MIVSLQNPPGQEVWEVGGLGKKTQEANALTPPRTTVRHGNDLVQFQDSAERAKSYDVTIISITGMESTLSNRGPPQANPLQEPFYGPLRGS